MTETPGDLLGVLEGQEHAGLAPHVGGPGRDVLALEADAAGGDLVVGVGQQRVGQGGLARPVGAHEGVHLAGRDGEVDAPEDLACPRPTTCRSSIWNRGGAHGAESYYALRP